MRLSTSQPQNVQDPFSRFFSSDGRIGLLYSSASLTRVALYGITLAAVANHPVWVLDGANSFDAYFVARLARGWNYAPELILSRIHLSRAFTCYQLAESITRRMPVAPAKPMDAERSKMYSDFRSSHCSATVFCLGLLDTFYDEDVPLLDAVRLLRSIVASIAGLARSGHTVFITAREPRQPTLPKGASRSEDRRRLMSLLIEAATHTKRIDLNIEEPTVPGPTQLQLMAG